MRLSLLAVLASALFAGCGSSDDSTETTSATAAGAGGVSAGGSGAGASGVGGSTGGGSGHAGGGSGGESANAGGSSGNHGLGGAAGTGGSSAGAGGASGGNGGGVAGAAGAAAGNGGTPGGAAGAGGVAGGAGGVAGGAGGVSGAAGSAGAFATAPHAPLPLLQPHGKKIVSNPQIVTVTFPGYPRKADVAAFGDAMASTSWLPTVGADYGVGAATHLAAVELPEPALKSMTDAEVQALLAKHVKDVLPAITANTIYVVYTPLGTTVDDTADGGGVSCDSFLGYHGAGSVGASTLVYAIVADCTGLTLADITNTASHEITEAATDPTDGWWYEAPDSDPWAWIDDGTEDADLCEWYDNITISGVAFTRAWSNTAAAKGESPCIPVPAGDVYRNVSPDKLTLQTVKPGESTTFTLTGWSTAEVPDWTINLQADSLSATDASGAAIGFTPTGKLSSTTINNGKTVTLTLTVPMGTPSGSVGVMKVASDTNGAQFWPVGVQTP